MLSIVAIRLRLVSFSGARTPSPFQRPLNSSISVMNFGISGVMVIFPDLVGRPYIDTAFLADPT